MTSNSRTLGCAPTKRKWSKHRVSAYFVTIPQPLKQFALQQKNRLPLPFRNPFDQRKPTSMFFPLSPCDFTHLLFPRLPLGLLSLLLSLSRCWFSPSSRSLQGAECTQPEARMIQFGNKREVLLVVNTFGAVGTTLFYFFSWTSGRIRQIYAQNPLPDRESCHRKIPWTPTLDPANPLLELTLRPGFIKNDSKWCHLVTIRGRPSFVNQWPIFSSFEFFLQLLSYCWFADHAIPGLTPAVLLVITGNVHSRQDSWRAPTWQSPPGEDQPCSADWHGLLVHVHDMFSIFLLTPLEFRPHPFYLTSVVFLPLLRWEAPNMFCSLSAPMLATHRCPRHVLTCGIVTTMSIQRFPNPDLRLKAYHLNGLVLSLFEIAPRMGWSPNIPTTKLRHLWASLKKGWSLKSQQKGCFVRPTDLSRLHISSHSNSCRQPQWW